VKNRFQNLPFKCNLQRYNAEYANASRMWEVLMFDDADASCEATRRVLRHVAAFETAGLHKLNPFDHPQLARAERQLTHSLPEQSGNTLTQ
jgi:hypothetical protein